MGIPILSSLDPLLGMVLYLVHLLHNKLNSGSPASLSLIQLHRLPNFGCPYTTPVELVPLLWTPAPLLWTPVPLLWTPVPLLWTPQESCESYRNGGGH